jgi:hypothetical protein
MNALIAKLIKLLEPAEVPAGSYLIEQRDGRLVLCRISDGEPGEGALDPLPWPVWGCCRWAETSAITTPYSTAPMGPLGGATRRTFPWPPHHASWLQYLLFPSMCLARGPHSNASLHAPKGSASLTPLG